MMKQNKVLIKAAPDLLHAAKLALAVLCVEYKDGEGIVDAADALHAFGNLKAAIDKAEGRENNDIITSICVGG